MICPSCNFEQIENNSECIKCGIIFDKYFEHQKFLQESGIDPEGESVTEYSASKTWIDFFKDLFLYVNPSVDPFYLCGRGIVFLMLLIWGLTFIFTPMESNYVGESFWHLVNLPFHEAGHMIFRLFGDFMAVLGGSLMQLLMPLVCMLTLLIKTRDTFGASVAMWWFAENLMDIAPYINDARDLRLMLLGGVTGRDVPGYHDWQNILGRLGLIEYDHALARLSYGLGIVIMVLALALGAYLLLQQYKFFRLVKGEKNKKRFRK